MKVRALKIIKDVVDLNVMVLSKQDLNLLSDYESQESSSQSGEHRNNYVKSNMELMSKKNNSDSLKTEI